MKKTITAPRARQGAWGRPVLLVLIVSLILAALVWWGVEMYGNAIQSPNTNASPETSAPPPAQ